MKRKFDFIFRTVVFEHMEIALHDSYGSKDFWTARRSMRYNQELYEIASKFRKLELNSNDAFDKTERPADWRKEKVIVIKFEYNLVFIFF